MEKDEMLPSSIAELNTNQCTGIKQSGLARTIADAIGSVDTSLQGLLWANIGLVGGNVLFPGFKERL